MEIYKLSFKLLSDANSLNTILISSSSNSCVSINNEASNEVFIKSVKPIFNFQSFSFSRLIILSEDITKFCFLTMPSHSLESSMSTIDCNLGSKTSRLAYEDLSSSLICELLKISIASFELSDNTSPPKSKYCFRYTPKLLTLNNASLISLLFRSFMAV